MYPFSAKFLALLMSCPLGCCVRVPYFDASTYFLTVIVKLLGPELLRCDAQQPGTLAATHRLLLSGNVTVLSLQSYIPIVSGQDDSIDVFPVAFLNV